MSETQNMFLPNEEIFQSLKEYIKSNSSISTVWVGRNLIQNKNPIVVFEEARNELKSQSTTYDHSVRYLNYNINVYCNYQDDNYGVVKELCTLIAEVMEELYHMKGGVVAMLSNYDGANKIGYRANLRYTANYIPKNLRIY